MLVFRKIHIITINTSNKTYVFFNFIEVFYDNTNDISKIINGIVKIDLTFSLTLYYYVNIICCFFVIIISGKSL